MAIATSDVFDANGKKVAVATGSSVILPDRPAIMTTELTLPDLTGSENDEEHRDCRPKLPAVTLLTTGGPGFRSLLPTGDGGVRQAVSQAHRPNTRQC
jgi:hypothetical protein